MANAAALKLKDIAAKVISLATTGALVASLLPIIQNPLPQDASDDAGALLTEPVTELQAPSEEEKQAILDGYLADGTITEEDLDDEFLVSALTGAPTQEQQAMAQALANGEMVACANETEEGQEAIDEYLQQQEDKDQQAQADAAEALAQLEENPQPDPIESYEQEQAVTAGTIVPEGQDAALPISDLIVKTGEDAPEESLGDKPADDGVASSDEGSVSYATGENDLQAAVVSSQALGADDDQAQAGSIAAATAASIPDYSMTPVVADIKTMTVYRQGWNNAQDSFPIGTDPSTLTMFVECNRTPSFYAPVIGGYFLPYQGDKDQYGFPLHRYVVTIKLPSAEGMPAKTVDVLWGLKQNDPSVYGYIQQFEHWKVPKPAVNDSTILATFAAVDGYDETRTTAYLNAYKMAPFASAEDLVASGNAAPADSPFATKNISEMWPIHETDGMKVSLFEEDAPHIVRNYVYFADGSHVTQDVTYQQSKGLVASYVVNSTGMLYQPNMWLIDSVGKKGVDNIASFIRSKTWSNWFASWISAQAASKNVKMHRVIRDHFDVDMHENAEEVAANLLTSIPAWSPTGANTAPWSNILNTAKTELPADDWKNPVVERKLFNLLFLYAYYEELLSFDTGGSSEIGLRKDSNLFLTVAFRGGVLRGGCSLVNMTSKVMSTSMLSFSYIEKLTDNSFPSTLSQYVGTTNSATIVENFVRKTTDYTDVCDWFADHMSSIAFFHEYEPLAIEGVSDKGQLRWRAWDQAKRFPDWVLYWITLPPGSQYFASTSMIIATGSTGIYTKNQELSDANRESFKKKIDAIYDKIKIYAPTLASIVGVNTINAFCIVNVDQKSSKLDNGTSYMEREGLWNKKLTEDPYHKYFSDPTELFNNQMNGAAAKSLNVSLLIKRIFYGAYAALNCNFDYYWSHEMTHAIDNDVFTAGETRCQPENYTDGLMTQTFGTNSYVMNLFNSYDKSADVSSNFTAERVNSTEKLEDYYHKMYETLDLLDYAALKAFLRLNKDEQNAVATQAWHNKQNGDSALDAGSQSFTMYPRNTIIAGYDGTHATMPVNAGAFNDGSKKFETPEEVYDNQVFLRPGVSGPITWGQEIYVADDLRGVWWYPMHHNGSYSSSRTFKLVMYQFLGRGNYKAWQNYGRTGGGDLAKLQSALGVSSYKQWQLDTWNGIESKKGQLTYVGFDDLVSKFETALRTDASKADRNLTQMTNLRQRMYYMMKRVTDDFRNGIYENQAPVTYIRNLADLQAISQNPYGNYVLANDIDVAGCAVDAPLVDGVFYGKLDGAGHRIYSSRDVVPCVFANMKHAYVKNLNLVGCVAKKPSVNATNSEWENINYELFTKEIRSVDDLLQVSDYLALGVSSYKLMADLDLSQWSQANAAAEEPASAVIPGLTVGAADSYCEFNGNGHRITGLHEASLFEKLAYADIHGLTMADCSNLADADTGDSVGLIAGRSCASRFSDLYFDNVELRGKYRLGFVVGDDGLIDATGAQKNSQGSEFSRIQVVNGQMTNGSAGATNTSCYAGFVTGRALKSSLQDIYVHGTLNVMKSSTGCGGVVGAIRDATTLDRCVSNVAVVRSANSTISGGGKNGCVLGDIENAVDATRISNSLGLGSPTSDRSYPNGRFGFMSGGSAAVFQNCYENSIVNYGTSLYFSAPDGVKWVRTDDIVKARNNSGATYTYPEEVPDLRNNRDFYANLGFDDQVWDFDSTIGAGFPMLRVDNQELVSYDLGMAIDFQREELVFTGSDFDASITMLRNLPFQYLNPPANSGMTPGYWLDVPTDTYALSRILTALERPDEQSIDLTPIIESEKLKNGEVAEKGHRTLTLSQQAADVGKLCSYYAMVDLPPRLENPYASSIMGVRANSKGVGSIRLAMANFEGSGVRFEYRAAPQETQADPGTIVGVVANAVARAAADAGWTTIASARTEVAPGTYEVRVASTDKAFATYATTVTVGEFDPNAVTFPLALDTCGGTWADGFQAPSEYMNEDATPLPDGDSLSRPGYEFAGWYADASYSGSQVTEVPAGLEEPVAYYAKWAPKRYGVSFQLDGGTLAGPQSGLSSYVHGTAAALPIAERNGYEFAGWYDNAQCDGAALTAIPEDSIGNLQLWAKWEPAKYRISYELNGGTWSDGYAPPDSSTVESPEIPLPGADDLARTGFAFNGWYADAALTQGPVTFAEGGHVGNRTYYADWQSNALLYPELAFESFELALTHEVPVQWDAKGYARVVVPRSKMPQVAADFEVLLPEGVNLTSFQKRGQEDQADLAEALQGSTGANPLAAAFEQIASVFGQGRAFADERAGGQDSDIWDILLTSQDDPTKQAGYTLEVVPQDESGSTGGNTGGTTGSDNVNGSGSGAGSGSVGNTGSNGSNGSGSKGDGSSGKDGGSKGSGGSGAEGDGGAGNGNGDGSGSGSGSKGPGGSSSGLAQTGDATLGLVAGAVAVAVIAAFAALLALRRRARR